MVPAGAGASETDQFLALGVELEDSADVINTYISREAEALLAKLSRRRVDVACERVPLKLYRRLFPSLLQPRIRRRLVRDHGIDRHPGADVGYFGHLARSIYRKPVFPFFVPLARTIRIGDVYLGADKLGHFFGHGRRYYRRYLDEVAEGAGEQEAMARVVRWGVRMEATLVGRLVDGVFSHADLEAAFQGLLMARRFCEGEEVYLRRSDDGWRLRREIDLRVYVNPAFDESYNGNHYAGCRWRGVRTVLIDEHCPKLFDEQVQERLRTYREIDEPSFSRRLIRDEYLSRGKYLRVHQTLAVVRAQTPP